MTRIFVHVDPHLALSSSHATFGQCHQCRLEICAAMANGNNNSGTLIWHRLILDCGFSGSLMVAILSGSEFQSFIVSGTNERS